MRRVISAIAVLLVLPVFLRAADEPPKGRTAAEIVKELAEITAPPAKRPDAVTAEREDALRRLKAYRYLAGIPYDDLTLDDDANAACDAACRLCAKLGHIEHTPANPGLPEDEYKLAYKGTSRSNLGQGIRSLVKAVDIWMDDSDPGNIDRLGHRRWCLNPTMGKTGFGRFNEYTAMYVFDRSRKNVPAFDFICWPPRGLVPVGYFRRTNAWSVTLNPRKYNPPDKDGTASIYVADRQGKKTGDAIKLNYSGIDKNGFGIPNCIIFRPERIAVEAGRRYVVAIEGVTRGKEKKAVEIEYLVEFIGGK